MSENFNGWPLDRSPSTQLKYDLLAERFATGFENHHRRTAQSTSSSEVFSFITVVIRVIIAISIIVFTVIKWIVVKFNEKNI